jgi:tetratricopeptide (TPR) repeat protein
MEAKVREHQFRALIRQSRWAGRSLDVSSAARFLEALARACAAQGKLEQAVESCVRGLQLVDRHDNSHYHDRLRRALVEILTEGDGDGVDAALRYYETKLLPDGEIPRLRVVLGEAYREAGEEEKALQQFSIAAELMPKDIELRGEVIEGYRKLDRPDEVEKAYLAWARLDPQNIEIYRDLGRFYERRGRSDDAMRAYATMAEARPREAEGHRAYARILAAKGQLQKAIPRYVAARRYRPTEFALARELAATYRRAGREEEIAPLWADGEAACRRAIVDLPDDPLPWLNLARFLKAQGKVEQARALCNRIVRRDWPRFGAETREEARDILNGL